MSDDKLFVRVPEALFDDLRHGEITPVMFTCMVLLHRWANWHTGVVRTCSAARLRTAMGGDSDLIAPDQLPSERTIQRSMQALHESGRIVSRYRKGSKKPYPVTICNYVAVADKGAEQALINPSDTHSWTDTRAYQGADKGTDEDGEKALSRRGKGDLNETSYETSNKTVNETSKNEIMKERGREGNFSLLDSPANPGEQGSTRLASEQAYDLCKHLQAELKLKDYPADWPALAEQVLAYAGGAAALAELKEMISWAIRDKFWTIRLLGMEKFLRFLKSDSENGLKNKFYAAKRAAETATKKGSGAAPAPAGKPKYL